MGQEASVPQDEVVDDNDASSSDGSSTEGSESGSESFNNDEMNKDEESEEKKSGEDKNTNESSSTPTKPKERIGEETPTATKSSDTNAPSKELSNERIAKEAPPPQDAPITLLINKDQTHHYFSINKFTNTQLEDRLSQLSLSRKSILSVSKQQRAHVTLYRQEGATPQELEAMEVHTNAAVRILGFSPELRSLRFCLVPGKLSEGRFWGSVFWVLQHGNRVPSSSGNGVVLVNVDAAPSKSKGVERSTSVMSDASDVTTTAEDLQRLLRRKDVELVHLRKELEESKLALTQFKEQQQQQNGTSTTNYDKNTNMNKHKGKWIMDQDCVDFLALDEELKANLRREKTKKLNEVRSQMKFILETDDYDDTTGKWDCCGKTSYGVDCGA